MHLVEANGAKIPALGFGTWELRGDQARRMVGQALEIGYRHIDTAQMYGNEVEVGEAIRASGVSRPDVFLTTKIWPEQFRAADFERAVENSLQALKLGYVDLLLLHWPSAEVPLAETLAVLDDIKVRGLARHIGVSNFTTAMLDETVKLARSPIATNQVEYHPFLSQRRLLAKQRQLGISLTAYCPIARGQVFENEVIGRIARKYGRDASQITLRWLIQQEGVIAIPRTSKPEHARSNFQIFDFALEESEMAEIHALGSVRRRTVQNAFAPQWDEE